MLNLLITFIWITYLRILLLGVRFIFSKYHGWFTRFYSCIIFYGLLCVLILIKLEFLNFISHYFVALKTYEQAFLMFAIAHLYVALVILIASVIFMVLYLLFYRFKSKKAIRKRLEIIANA